MQRSLDNTLEEDIGSERLERIERVILETISEQQASTSPINHRITLDHPHKEPELFARELTRRWIRGESPRQIAQEMGQPMRPIYDMLKRIDKTIIEEKWD